ncbi:hypothetical protein OU5_0878 [Pseudomonas mandelii JR-1]|uniref:Uncharacterized protein n=1 Tax=Pseudomonas mandelii JR-1 TaxID=1147786 RepID=A0A024E574_9PSED|nr:hypothetical protein OU5_0878 [Pseudomonas mandelii JR-1]
MFFKTTKSSQLVLALGHTDALKNLDHPRIKNRTLFYQNKRDK